MGRDLFSSGERRCILGASWGASVLGASFHAQPTLGEGGKPEELGKSPTVSTWNTSRSLLESFSFCPNPSFSSVEVLKSVACNRFGFLSSFNFLTLCSSQLVVTVITVCAFAKRVSV